MTNHEVVLIPYYPEVAAATAGDNLQTPMLVELHPKDYHATLYMKAGDRISTTTAGAETPSPSEITGKN